jgi:hypothetical protein
MIIKTKVHKEQLRTELAILLRRNRFNLMSFLTSFNDDINLIEKRTRTIKENYKLIYNRLNKCVTIDLEFIQKLIDLVDKSQKVKVVEITNKQGKKESEVRIGKMF